jgi:formyltetrahydrofolate deformylase
MNTPIRQSAHTTGQCVLTFSCPDRPGLVFEVSRFLVEHGCTIVESQQLRDPAAGRFFMRVQFADRDGGPLDVETLRTDFTPVAVASIMNWRLTRTDDSPRVLIMVSKYGHCLNDLLYRASTGSLDVTIPAVVSNHPDLGTLADNFDVPFHHIPVTPDSKEAAEAELLGLVDSLDIDLVVLARYM